MEFFEMSLAIILVIVTWIGAIATIKWIWTLLKHWFGYMVERREPVLQDNQELIDIATEQVRPEREEEEEKMWDLHDSPDQGNDGTTSTAAPVAPSSSLSSAVEWKYDVFLSFRGPDTRKGITFELYDRLQRRGIKTFMDDRDLEVGNVISPTLLRAIRESRFAIVVLSQNYASSTWCLEELREICLCMEDNRILPLFYHVGPTDVRYQKRSFKDAFSKHETSERHESEKVKQWRAALYKVANISGWNTNDYKTHQELVDVIVESLRSKVPPDAIESTGDFQAYKATTQAMDEVKKALTDDEITAVGVYGMGGVGKTSMVRHVAAQACKNGTFNHWIMAAISQSPDFRNIQGTLADFLGVKFVEETESGRADRLHKEIMRREKLLIILDDAWERIELSAIGIPSYEKLQKCTSKVVLTTRKLHVCDSMDSQRSIPLNILSEQDSWTLFVRNAGVAKKILESTTFKDVARRVSGECRGLPIALIAVARALRDKDQAEWDKAARRLEKSQSAIVEDEKEAFKCIKFSYDYLKDEDSKSCFLLCCLYPEDHDILVEQLFRCAIGKGLFRDAETIEEARGTADSVVKYLKDSSLLLDSEKKGCVKMHDVIRDTALNIAKSEDGHGFLVRAGCGLKDWPRGLHEGCTAISLMRNSICTLPKEELVCPNLQILFLQENTDLTEIPEKFIQSLNELRVLDLSFTYISSLPQSFSLLTNLQALNLDFCKKLIDISVLGKLKRLEILRMRNYRGKELSTEMGHLTNLRILEVSCAASLIIPSKVILKLHKLEELYTQNCEFEDWGSKVEREGEETELVFPVLSNLKIWRIRTPGYRGEGVNDRYGRNSRSLFLYDGSTMSTLPDWFINVVTEKTEELEYRSCKGMSDILTEYDHGRLHELKHLRVDYDDIIAFEVGMVDMKELMNTTRRVLKGPVFENLEELHLMALLRPNPGLRFFFSPTPSSSFHPKTSSFRMMQQPSGGVVPADQQPQQQYQQQPPQQWMMMPPQQQQHQAAAAQAAQAGWAQQQAAMQQQQQQQPQQYTAAAAGQGSDEIRSLWIGDLLQWMDENYILNCFGPTGEAVNAKVIRNKQTGLPEGYGFIEFRTRSAAEQVLQNYNGTVMPNTEQNFRLNWATLGAGERRQDDGPDYTVFVGDLAADVTDYTLQETFRAHYHSVKGAKVVTDRTTGRSKGYGFVRFGDESEQLRAMNEMNGQFCSSRPMRIGPAATKKPVGGGQPFQKAAYPSSQGNPGEADPNNTTIFVGGLDPSVDDEMLRQSFGMFGELVHVKIPVGKRCGFVQFANRACAEQALSVMNGRVVGSQSVRLSWGRSPSSKQNQPEQTQWNGAGGAGFYQYPQGYDAYTYAPPTQDPNLYYGGYAGYGNYQQPGAAYQQQQQ